MIYLLSIVSWGEFEINTGSSSTLTIISTLLEAIDREPSDLYAGDASTLFLGGSPKKEIDHPYLQLITPAPLLIKFTLKN